MGRKFSKEENENEQVLKIFFFALPLFLRLGMISVFLFGVWAYATMSKCEDQPWCSYFKFFRRNTLQLSKTMFIFHLTKNTAKI